MVAIAREDPTHQREESSSLYTYYLCMRYLAAYVCPLLASLELLWTGYSQGYSQKCVAHQPLTTVTVYYLLDNSSHTIDSTQKYSICGYTITCTWQIHVSFNFCDFTEENWRTIWFEILRLGFLSNFSSDFSNSLQYFTPVAHPSGCSVSDFWGSHQIAAIILIFTKTWFLLAKFPTILPVLFST